MKNPFEYEIYGGRIVQACDAQSRCDRVRNFTRAQCEAAMKITYLQASVYQAIQRRLRQLEREKLKSRPA
ncbi:MAG: hypothetical protein ACOC0Q_09035 [Wenzhouxiangella sp.]